MGLDWSMLSEHGRVLVYIARNPDVSLAQLSRGARVGRIATSRIVDELLQSGVLTRRRLGRGNRYLIDFERSLPASTMESGLRVDDVLRPFIDASE